jgi:HSP20 family protein
MRLTPWRKQMELSRDFPGAGTFQALRDRMDRLFDSFFAGDPSSESGFPGTSGGWSPSLEVTETDKELVVRAEMPGLKPEDIDVRLAGNVLTLSGEKKEESEDKKSGFYRSERQYGCFCRTLELPPGTKSDAVSAEFDKGVLTLKIPKDEATFSRKIEVKSASGKSVDIRKENPGQDRPKSK